MAKVTQAELREMSRRLRESARTLESIQLRRNMAAAALALAELAEELDREGAKN